MYTEGVVVVNDPMMKVAKAQLEEAKGEQSNITPAGLTRVRELSPARYGQVAHPPSFATFRNPVSQYIHIIGLKRPYSNKQLQDLLLSFGEVLFDEDNFWIDKVKSNCIVKASSSQLLTV